MKDTRPGSRSLARPGVDARREAITSLALAVRVGRPLRLRATAVLAPIQGPMAPIPSLAAVLCDEAAVRLRSCAPLIVGKFFSGLVRDHRPRWLSLPRWCPRPQIRPWNATDAAMLEHLWRLSPAAWEALAEAALACDP